LNGNTRHKELRVGALLKNMMPCLQSIQGTPHDGLKAHKATPHPAGTIRL
jgi:hypothetical protein